MKRVLIITYYWPPSGGAGVQRWLKFAKYLRGYGWEPVIYTPENPESPAEDLSLMKDIPENLEIIRSKIWEPYALYKKFVGRKSTDRIKTGFLNENKKPGLAEKISVWIRGNLFIPDARKFWIKPSIKHLVKYLKDHPADAVVSTGPPHSMHLIALGLKKELGFPWLADFRDPWTNIDFYSELRLTRRSDRRHRELENEVLRIADRVVVVGKGMADVFHELEPRRYDIITNGYDEPAGPLADIRPDRKFSVAHIGSMVPSRNPEALWQALGELCNSDTEFREVLEIKLVGQVDHSVVASIHEHGLEKYLNRIDYLPHDEVVKVQMQAGLLLLLINDTPNAKMVVTGKLFEYMRSGRPVLCIGPTDGDAAALLADTGTGETIDPGDIISMKKALMNSYLQHKKGEPFTGGEGIEKYSRKNLTGDLARLLDEL